MLPFTRDVLVLDAHRVVCASKKCPNGTAISIEPKYYGSAFCCVFDRHVSTSSAKHFDLITDLFIIFMRTSTNVYTIWTILSNNEHPVGSANVHRSNPDTSTNATREKSKHQYLMRKCLNGPRKLCHVPNVCQPVDVGELLDVQMPSLSAHKMCYRFPSEFIRLNFDFFVLHGTSYYGIEPSFDIILY